LTAHNQITTMESIVSISDDPNNQLAFVQQLVSQLSVAGNPVTINVVNNHVHNGDIVNNNGNSNNDNNNNNNNNDSSNNILEKLNEVSTGVKALQTGQTEQTEALTDLDEEVENLSEALTDLDEKVVNLSEALTDVKAEQTHQLAKLVDGITTSITAGMTALVAGQTQLVAGISPAITELVAATTQLNNNITQLNNNITQLNNIITQFINSNVILLAGQARLHGTLPPLLMRIMNEIRDGFQSLDAVDDDDDDE
jgi:prefoldin subunit 5